MCHYHNHRESEKREREASRVMEGDSPIVIILIVMFKGSCRSVQVFVLSLALLLGELKY